MLHSNHCQFILTILPTTTHQETLENMHYPYYVIVPGLAFVSCPLLRCCVDDPVKCPYTGPIGWLTNTYTSQNTLHKKGFNVNILYT